MAELNPWMLTRSRKRVTWPPNASMIDIDDIAWSLAHQCRYNGYTPTHYSVAEHCVLIAYWLLKHRSRMVALGGLLHDAAEAYTGDIPRPFKVHIPNWASIEDSVNAAIETKFELPPCLLQHPAVKEADTRILMDEKIKFFPDSPISEWGDCKALGVNVQGLASKTAYRLFLKAFEALK